MEAGTNNSHRNCNIISAFLFAFVCNSTGKKAIYAHTNTTHTNVVRQTQIVYLIQYRIWRLPDVLCILLLVCVFCSFVQPFKLLAIYCPHHPEQTVNTPAKNERSSSSSNTAKCHTLNWICLCHIIYYTHYALHVRMTFITLKCNLLPLSLYSVQKWDALEPPNASHTLVEHSHSFNRFVSKLDGCHGNHSAFCLFCQNLSPVRVLLLGVSVAYGEYRIEYTLCVCIYRYANSLFLSLASAGQYTSYAVSKHIFFPAFFEKRNVVVIFSLFLLTCDSNTVGICNPREEEKMGRLFLFLCSSQEVGECFGKYPIFIAMQRVPMYHHCHHGEIATVRLFHLQTLGADALHIHTKWKYVLCAPHSLGSTLMQRPISFYGDMCGWWHCVHV